MKRYPLCVLAALVFSVSLTAAIVEKPISYEHGGATLHGLLVYDEVRVSADEKLPGVLIIHQWMGRGEFEATQARRLASEGYVAFALDMYGEQPTNTAEARALTGQFYGKLLMAERARAGLNQLIASKFVDSEKVSAIGYCFGGTTAMALAYSGASLSGIVSFHGGLIEAPASGVAPEAEPIRAKFLLCHGAVDPFVPWAQVQATLDSLEAAKIDYQFIAYQGAVHSFTDPSATGEGSPGAKYQREAAERSWAHMLQFFEGL